MVISRPIQNTFESFKTLEQPSKNFQETCGVRTSPIITSRLQDFPLYGTVPVGLKLKDDVIHNPQGQPQTTERQSQSLPQWINNQAQVFELSLNSTFQTCTNSLSNLQQPGFSSLQKAQETIFQPSLAAPFIPTGPSFQNQTFQNQQCYGFQSPYLQSVPYMQQLQYPSQSQNSEFLGISQQYPGQLQNSEFLGVLQQAQGQPLSLPSQPLFPSRHPELTLPQLSGQASQAIPLIYSTASPYQQGMNQYPGQLGLGQATFSRQPQQFPPAYSQPNNNVTLSRQGKGTKKGSSKTQKDGNSSSTSKEEDDELQGQSGLERRDYYGGVGAWFQDPLYEQNRRVTAQLQGYWEGRGPP